MNKKNPDQIRSDSFNTAPVLLYFRKVTVTSENIEGRLIMSQQSLTPFFKSTSKKRKLQGPDGDHETTVAKKMQNMRSPNVIFQGEHRCFFQARAST